MLESDENPDQTLDAISELSKRRRELNKPEITRELPVFIEHIAATSIRLTFPQHSMPLPWIDPAKLSAGLKSAFGLRFTRPDMTSYFRLGGVNPAELTDEKLMTVLVQSSKPMLKFEGGRYPASKSESIPIEHVTLDAESINVQVQGVSKAAELVAAEAMEYVWASVGVSKRWEELEKNVTLREHATGTKVRLPFKLERLLNPALDRVLAETATAGGLASYMAPLSARMNFEPGSGTVASVNLDTIVVVFHVFDSTTGRADELELKFDVAARNERGMGVVNIVSRLPFEKHIDLVERVIRACEQETRGATSVAVRKEADRLHKSG